MSGTEQVDTKKVNFATVEPGEEVVISGIAGKFPACSNMEELKDNLLNKVDLITDNQSRWTLDYPDIPKAGGTVEDLEKFDALFFGIDFKQAHTMDPMCRILLELTYEAIIDAGINPRQLMGTNTGVVLGCSISESEKLWFYETTDADGFGITGCTKAMLANWISYTLDFHGPSYSVDTACSSSLCALDHAYRIIRAGTCDAVIVGGSNLCLQPLLSLQFGRLGVLSRDCRCKVFDDAANGYVRSEAICVILLQKAKDAKRIYSQIVYTKTNCDGYKEQGITFPASNIQKMLMKDFYEECQISPNCLSFLEAHGTGTAVGDPEELTTIDQVFCQGRKTPLKIGSIKSNLGHTEPSSGLCSIAKVIIGMESGFIPPNLHFRTPMRGMRCLAEGKAEIVTEPTPWEGGYVGINSFGFGGVNVHVLLKSHTKEKVNNGAPSDDLPRLVAVSGRTREALDTLLGYVESIPVDVEYVRLLHNIYAENIDGHSFRGYSLVGSKIAETPAREMQTYSGIKRPIWFVFSGMGSQWAGMGEALMKFPIFAKAIEKCDTAVKPHGIDIVDIVTNKAKQTFDDIINAFVGIAAIQIGLVDLLSSVGIEPDYIIGHSVGELGCAYADGCFTAEQMILAAYYRGLASVTTKLIPGSMAAVGLGYEEIKNLCPADIEVACHNGPDSSTISGPAESMKEFVAKLQGNKIFAKEVPCSNIAYHSRYVADAGPALLAHLKKVIPVPKPRGSKWLSTSVPRDQWYTPAAKYSSAEYHTNNLLNSVLFAETSTLIPHNAIAIEIAPHGLLQSILRRSLAKDVTNIALTHRGHIDNAEYLLQGLGKLYNAGLQPQLANIYPDVKFPVSRGTPMISPHIRWEHSKDWFVSYYTRQHKITTPERTVEIEFKDESYEYMAHHVIDGRNLVPATGYLLLVWETVGMVQGVLYDELSVVFENIKFERATTISAEGSVLLTIAICRGSGEFEITEESTTVVTGTIRITKTPEREMISSKFLSGMKDEEVLSTKDIYKELKLRGYEYTGLFRALKSASIGGTRGHIAWKKNWAAFMDNMLQMKILGTVTRALYVPTAIRKLVVNVKAHTKIIQSVAGNDIDIPVCVWREYDTIVAGGIEIRGVKANAIPRRKLNADPILEEYKFVPHRDRMQTSIEEMIVLSAQLALESNMTTTPEIFELVNDDDNLTTEEILAPILLKVLGDLPVIRANITLAVDTKKYKNLSLPETVTIIEPSKIPKNGTVFMATGYEILSRKKRDILSQLLLATNNHGFILLRESNVNDDTLSHLEACGLNIVLEKTFQNQTLLLLKKGEVHPQRTEIVCVNNNEFSWLEKVKEILQNEGEKETDETVRLVLVAQGDAENGLLGLVKCLRLEPNGKIVKAMIIQDENAPLFSLKDPYYAAILDIDIGYNVIRPGRVWGTYRHLPLPPPPAALVPHAYANITVRGNLSSIRWVEGDLKPDMKNSNVVRVVYSSLNFRDVMIATGKLLPETIAKDAAEAECLIGFEFSGIDSKGRRVMGFTKSKAISNFANAHHFNVWPVPDKWTLEDAATIPSAYCTVFYAFFYFGKLKKGEKVLIHSGSGAVGQAAINVALGEGCEVFTTVGTPEKRRFIKETFPSIDDDHIGNSRDTSFEQMVMKQTHGKGVNVVLNSLAEEKLQASVRCLSTRGRFLEIGKFDLAANSQLGMNMFLKEASFHGVMLDTVIDGVTSGLHEELHYFFADRLCSDAVKPLVRKCFAKDRVEESFRYMTTGQHIGKILIEVGDLRDPFDTPILAYPRFHAAGNKTYVLIGGLGGLGLELADWLILRGARSLVIVSRNGIKDGYQRWRTELWKSVGVQVLVISGVDASKTEDCEFILKSAEKQAPVDGIFNLAAVLKDCLMVNQTEMSFEESMTPKARITKKVDELSRQICPKLRYFVVFSSLSCGRGTPGQSNYGMANAVLERICEKRVEEGLPGMAIQWGAVGDVGLAAEMLENKQQLAIGGTLPQRISSCLEELDKFLCQCRPIVASMVVLEKRLRGSEASTVLEAVLNIMNIKDPKSIGQNSSLAELGMDSMVAVEIKQTLERDFEVVLTPQDIRVLTVAKLVEMSAKVTKNPREQVKQLDSQTKNWTDLALLVRSLDVPIVKNQYCVELPVNCVENKNQIFLIPGIEGSTTVYASLAPKLKVPATCLQLGIHDIDDTVEKMAKRLLPHVLARSKDRSDFTVVGYSYGTLLAIELVRRLEAHSLIGRLILIDGSPDYMKALKAECVKANTVEEYENMFLDGMLNIFKSVTIEQCMLELKECSNWDEKINTAIKHVPDEMYKIYTAETQKMIISFLHNQLYLVDKYNPSTASPLRTPITLLVPTVKAVQVSDLTYGLNKLTHGTVTVHEIEGNHITMMDNDKIALALNGAPIEDRETSEEKLHITNTLY